MRMKVRCPHCDSVYDVSGEHVGKKSKCPKCQNKFVLTGISIPKENELQICKNCREKIGQLEQTFVYSGNIVCKRCHEKLNKKRQEPITSNNDVIETTRGNEASLNIRYMQMKKSVGVALLCNFLWAGSGIYYAKCPKGRFIVWLNIFAFILSLVVIGAQSHQPSDVFLNHLLHWPPLSR